MLDQVEAELPDHIDHQHLRLIGQSEDAVAPEPRQIGQAEFAVAVNGGGAQEIADLDHLGEIGLAARGQRGAHLVEEAHAAVGAAQHQLVSAVTRRLLARGRLAQAFDGRLVDAAGGKREGSVPFLGDDPIRALFRRQRVGEAAEGQKPRRRLDLVDDAPEAAGIEIVVPLAEDPALAPHPADERAHEAEARGMEGAEARQAHDRGRRAERRFRRSLARELGRSRCRCGRLHGGRRSRVAPA